MPIPPTPLCPEFASRRAPTGGLGFVCGLLHQNQAKICQAGTVLFSCGAPSLPSTAPKLNTPLRPRPLLLKRYGGVISVCRNVDTLLLVHGYHRNRCLFLQQLLLYCCTGVLQNTGGYYTAVTVRYAAPGSFSACVYTTDRAPPIKSNRTPGTC